MNIRSTGTSCLEIAALLAVVAIAIFKPSPAMAQPESIIYSFAGYPTDGSQPYSDLVADAHGNFYSTTYAGGSNNAGTVFKLAPSASGWSESMLVSLGGHLGPSNPQAPVIGDSKGNIYTTASSGGALNYGEVFEISEAAGVWAVTGSLSFGAAGNGKYPESGLIADSDGNYYGTTWGGGSCGSGTVYKLTPGSTWAVTILHSFCGGATDGAFPGGGLIKDSGGRLYGTTYAGGATTYGTAFVLSPPEDSSWTLTVLHSFGATGDGMSPMSSLIMDSSGNLYGTPVSGGVSGYGIAFRLSYSAGAWRESEIVGFEGGTTDGRNPYGRLVMDSGGNLYGTTLMGGSNDAGIIFKLSGSPWTKSILHTFGGSGDGRNPYGGLTMDSSGNLYGATSLGGANNHGAVFKLAP